MERLAVSIPPTEVEQRPEPGEVLAVKVGAFLQPIHGSVVDAILVNIPVVCQFDAFVIHSGIDSY